MGALAVLAIPAYVAAVDWLPRIGAFDKATNLGNLIGPLSGWQLVRASGRSATSASTRTT